MLDMDNDSLDGLGKRILIRITVGGMALLCAFHQ